MARVWAGVRPSRNSRGVPSPGQLASMASRGPRPLAAWPASGRCNHRWHSTSRAGFCLPSFPRSPAVKSDGGACERAGHHGVIQISNEPHVVLVSPYQNIQGRGRALRLRPVIQVRSIQRAETFGQRPDAKVNLHVGAKSPNLPHGAEELARAVHSAGVAHSAPEQILLHAV